jgi:hypothetical protein
VFKAAQQIGSKAGDAVLKSEIGTLGNIEKIGEETEPALTVSWAMDSPSIPEFGPIPTRKPTLGKVSQLYEKSPAGYIERANEKIFEHSEAFWKRVVYQIRRNRQNATLEQLGTSFKALKTPDQQVLIREAVQAAEDAIFDYGLRPKWLEFLSKNTGSFGTYYYKAGGLVGKTLWEHPTRLWAINRLRQATGDYVDWTYMIPFADVSEALAGGDPTKGPLVTRVLRILSGFTPLSDLVANIVGFSTFKGKPTFDERDPESVQTRDVLTAFYQFIVP